MNGVAAPVKARPPKVVAALHRRHRREVCVLWTPRRSRERPVGGRFFRVWWLAGSHTPIKPSGLRGPILTKIRSSGCTGF